MRSVSVKLQADVAAYKAGLTDAARTTTAFGRDVSKTSRQAGADLDEIGTHARKLDEQIETCNVGIRSLAKGFANTGDVGLLKAIAQQQAMAQQLTRVRNLLPDPAKVEAEGRAAGDRSGRSFAGALRSKISEGARETATDLMTGMNKVIGSNPYLAAGITAAVAMAGPTAGAALSGALLAGIGSGALGIGIAASMKDPAVKAAVEDLKEQFGSTVTGIGADFSGEMQRALKTVGVELRTLGPELQAALAPAAGYIDPLVTGFTGLVRNLLPGFAEGVAAAGPIFAVLEQQLPEIGRALGDLFSTVAEHADEGASGISAMVSGAVLLIDAGATVIGWLSDAYIQALKVGIALTDVGSMLPGFAGEKARELNNGYRELLNVAEGSKSATTGTKEYATAADLAAAAVRGQRDALVELSNKMLAEANPVFGLIEAEKKLAEAKTASGKAIKEHGRKSEEAREATRNLALAAIELQGKAGALGATFDGKMTPAMYATLTAAGLTDAQIKNVAGQFRQAKIDGDKYAGKYAGEVSAPGAVKAKGQLDDAYTSANHFAGPYAADVKLNGAPDVEAKLKRLSVWQQALKKGMSPYFQGPIVGPDGKGYAEGGWTGPGGKYQPAGLVHADEFVIQKESRQRIEAQAPGLLDQMNRYGHVPGQIVPDGGYAAGGRVAWPFPTTAKGTRVPSKAEVSAVVAPAGPSGSGPTDSFILSAVRGAFPGMQAISVYRPGARTLSGNTSYHSRHRAVDWPASHAMAVWWNQHYMSRTKEFISPWNDLNIHNGRRHTYTGAVWNQHNFAGGNAHNHIAMANGGVIGEPVFGVGASGRTYSFAENGPETVIPGYARGGLVNVAPRNTSGSAAPVRGSRMDTAEAYIAARNAVASLTLSLRENGRTMSLNSAKGRENRATLHSSIKAAQDAAKAKYEETGSVRAANLEYDRHIRAIRAALSQQKVAAAVRIGLVNRLAARPVYDIPEKPVPVPKNSSSTVAFVQAQMGAEEAIGKASGFFDASWGKPTFAARTASGRDNLNALFDFLGSANSAAQARYTQTGSSKLATQLYDGYLRQLRVMLATAGMSKREMDALLKQYARITLGNRYGGVYEHAQNGLLKEAHIAAGGPTRYAYAEAATGGEFFGPRYGNLAKTRAEATYAVENWWGGHVTWQPGRSTAAQTAGGGQLTVRVVVQDGQVAGLVRVQVDEALGALADATVYATAN